MTTFVQHATARLWQQDAQIAQLSERIRQLEQHIFAVAGRYVALQAQPCPVCGECAVDDDGDCLECLRAEEEQC
jgi:DNA repair exonuclease SbcCD ATPase subunit